MRELIERLTDEQRARLPAVVASMQQRARSEGRRLTLTRAREMAATSIIAVSAASDAFRLALLRAKEARAEE
jgi:hypothetical protein